LYPDETTRSALDFLDSCQRFYQRHGITSEAVLTDNGKNFQRQWRNGCQLRGIEPLHTRPRRPQTNGKAERFIRTLLADSPRAPHYRSDHHRENALGCYRTHYTPRRRHRALNGHTPLQRLSTTSLGLTPGSANPRADAARWAPAHPARRRRAPKV